MQWQEKAFGPPKNFGRIKLSSYFGKIVHQNFISVLDTMNNLSHLICRLDYFLSEPIIWDLIVECCEREDENDKTSVYPSSTVKPFLLKATSQIDMKKMVTEFLCQKWSAGINLKHRNISIGSYTMYRHDESPHRIIVCPKMMECWYQPLGRKRFCWKLHFKWIQ